MDYNINIFVIIHIIIVLLYVILPFLPIRIIRDYNLYWFTIIPPLLWVIFCRCPLSDFEKANNKQHFTKYIIDNFCLNQQRFEYIIIFYLIFSLCIIISRL